MITIDLIINMKDHFLRLASWTTWTIANMDDLATEFGGQQRMQKG